jgi:hypothetical protein
MVLYLSGAPSESTDCPVGGVAHWIIGASGMEFGVSGGEFDASPDDGIDVAGDPGSAATLSEFYAPSPSIVG